MYNKRKIFTLILCALMIFSVLSACGKDSSYRNDVLVSDISATIDSVISSGADMKNLTDTYITGSMNMDVSEYEEYSIKICSKGLNIDEYGIFKATDASHAKQIAKSVEAYLQMRIDTWMVEYMPEEYPKVKNADIKTCGNYVMYAILSDEEKSTAFSAFEAAVSAK